ncbi:MAG: bile acid:Na+ symporter, family [Desulfovibrionales bacterium]|jgi:BASS family bile acid:Na+ symporter|nr:bile acid:Na+ symporter, family [Desulfovibrionales bacterium]
MLAALARFFESHFLMLAILLSGLALIAPDLFLWIKPHIALFLGVIMFGMGLTLEFKDFKGVASRWRLVGLGALLQYGLMPLIGLGAATLFGLPPQVALGLVLVGACPGGTASNVITYLAKGNVALSVTMTMASTLLAPVVTPAIIWLIFHERIDIHFGAMVASVFWIVVFPLADGLVLRRLLRRGVRPLLAVFPSISILSISVVIACVVAMNRVTILGLPLLVMAAVVCHNLAGFGAGYVAARLTGCDVRDARTVSIEVGMQNSGLGVALAYTYFSVQAALPGALFSLEQNLAGVGLVKIWRRENGGGLKEAGGPEF